MRFKLSFWVLILISNLCYLNCAAQKLGSYLYENLTIEKGLPSNETYQIVEDKDHFLWIATDNGLVKYDGKKFQVYNSNDGLPNNVVLHFFKQPNGKIYGMCRYNKFFCIEGSKIVPFPFNDIVSSSMSDFSYTHSFYIDKLGTSHIGTSLGKLVIGKNGKIIKKCDTYEPKTFYGSLSYEYFPNIVLTYNARRKSIEEPLSLGKIEAETKKIIFKAQNRFIYNSNYNEKIDSSKVALIFNGAIYIIQSEKIIQVLESKTPPVSVNYIDSTLWIGTILDGVYKYKMSAGKFILEDNFLQGNTVTSVHKDFQGGLWFTTRETGLIHLNNFDLTTIYSSKNGGSFISTFYKDREKSIIGFEDGKVRFLEDTTKKLQIIGKINSIIKLGNENISIFNFGEHHKYNYETNKLLKSPLFTERHGFPVYTADTLNSNLIISYSTLAFAVYDKIVGKTIHQSEANKSNSIFTDKLITKDKIIIGQTRGISFYNRNTYKLIKKIDLPSSVTSVMSFEESIIVTCKSGDIYLFSNEEIIEPKLIISGLSMITDAAIFKGKLLITSNIGIHKFNFKQNSIDLKNQEFISVPEIKKIEIFDNEVFYISKNKIYRDNIISRRIIPITQIDSIKVNGEKTSKTLLDKALTYNQNNIIFSVNSISYSQPFSKFRFQLIGHDKDPRYTSEMDISYPNLHPGDYEFIISSSTNGINFYNTKKLKFSILPPFWKTIWFIALTVLVTLAILIFTFYFQLKRIRTKLTLQKSISELKSLALTSQLNPHLIFNVLNSIQGIISKGETKDANRYLARFSKFMRLSLNLSKQVKINIRDEIEIMQNYIDLELLRFPELIISINNELTDLDYFIPPLITQPFIENAVKHGVMPSKNHLGVITIHIKSQNNVLEIIIEDNGVGFNEPFDFNKGDGMRISKERLEILHPKNKVYIDSSSSTTKVILNIHK